MCGKKRIDRLFSTGDSVLAYPIRAVYILQEQAEAPVSVLVSVPKRHFKHAVDRNRMKRRIREAYRLNKHLLTDSLGEGQYLAVAFLWTNDVTADYPTVEAKMKKLLQRIGEQLRDAEQQQSADTPC